MGVQDRSGGEDKLFRLPVRAAGPQTAWAPGVPGFLLDGATWVWRKGLGAAPAPYMWWASGESGSGRAESRWQCRPRD